MWQVRGIPVLVPASGQLDEHIQYINYYIYKPVDFLPASQREITDIAKFQYIYHYQFSAFREGQPAGTHSPSKRLSSTVVSGSGGVGRPIDYILS